MISIEKVDIMYNNYTHIFSMIDNHIVNLCLSCYKVGVMIQSSHNLNLWNHITLVKGLQQCNSTLCPCLIYPSCFILVLVNEVQVQCLQKPYGISERWEFEHEKDIIFYTKWFSMQISTQKWSRRGENGFGHIKK